MKKIILLIITFLLSFLVFSGNAKALNSDATATCVYTFPSTAYYSGATIKYANGEIVSTSCSARNGFEGVYYACKILVLATFFEDEENDKIVCPDLNYYFNYNTYTDFHLYMLLDNGYLKKELSATEQKETTSISPSSSSSINQGNPANSISAQEDLNYLQCLCGSYLLITRSGVSFTGEGLNSYDKRYISFDPEAMTSCPAGIYYKAHNLFKYVEISSTNFDGATELACANTDDIKKYSGTSGNPTNYIPQEDIILPFCTETAKIWKMVGYLMNALRIMVPVLIIVMGSIDLGKAVVAQNEEDIKKGTQLIIKRVMAGIIIFFLPTVVNLIFKFVSGYSSVVSNNSGCVECVMKPWNC
ncbi:MAG TPA: hypothetical protein PLX66_00375 [Bacilli bacterium]|nr:hypothetical protein [Bacilli bacterium]